MPEAVRKHARAKNAQHCFLYCLSPIAVVSVFIFQTSAGATWIGQREWIAVTPASTMGANLHAVEAGLVILFGFGRATGSNAYGTVGSQILLSSRPDRAYSRAPPEA